MDGIAMLIFMGLLVLDALYSSRRRVAVNSGELMYKYQVLGLRRRYKSMRGLDDVQIRDNL